MLIELQILLSYFVLFVHRIYKNERTNVMKKCKISDLLIFILSAELVGVASSLLSGNFSGIYTNLEKPPLSPPGIVFPIVWTILYALMGISACIIYSSNAEQKEKQSALRTYWLQLVVNFFWSIVFFRFQALWTSVIVIITLLVLIIVMIVKFGRINRIAAYLNIPYLIWVIFAAYLNIATAVIN